MSRRARRAARTYEVVRAGACPRSRVADAFTATIVGAVGGLAGSAGKTVVAGALPPGPACPMAAAGAAAGASQSCRFRAPLTGRGASDRVHESGHYLLTTRPGTRRPPAAAAVYLDLERPVCRAALFKALGAELALQVVDVALLEQRGHEAT